MFYYHSYRITIHIGLSIHEINRICNLHISSYDSIITLLLKRIQIENENVERLRHILDINVYVCSILTLMKQGATKITAKAICIRPILSFVVD